MGVYEFEGFIIDNFNLSIADSYAVLNKVRLHIDKLGNKEPTVHGNFGQDYIK